MLVKLRFRAKVAHSRDLVCRDRVRILCTYVRGVLLHSPPPLGGARLDSDHAKVWRNIQPVSYTHLTLPTKRIV